MRPLVLSTVYNLRNLLAGFISILCHKWFAFVPQGSDNLAVDIQSKRHGFSAAVYSTHDRRSCGVEAGVRRNGVGEDRACDQQDRTSQTAHREYVRKPLFDRAGSGL